MKGKIKCILSSVSFRPLSFALLLTLSLVLSSLTPLVANAAATDEIPQTERVYVGGDAAEGTGLSACGSEEDFTLNWSEILYNTSSPNYYKNTWNYTSNYDGAQAKQDAFFDRFDANLAEGAGWGVAQSFDNGYPEIDIFVFDPDADLTVNDGYIAVSGSAVWTHGFAYNPNAYCRWQDLKYSHDVRYTLPTSPNTWKYLFIVSDNIDYPEGYEGSPVPGGVGTKTVVKPDFTYSVNNKDVQAKDYNLTLPTITPDEGYTIEGYSVEWSLFKCGSYTDVGNLCNDSSLSKYQILGQDDTFNYSVSDYGDYHLQANYLVQECYRYPSYPATPDYCFYVDFGAEAELDDYDFTSTTVHLKIDGSSFSGDTKEGECDVSGFCEPPSPYEDCSTYGLDIVGGLGCVIRNFGVWLTNTLKMLFIPTGQFFNELFSDFGDFFNEKLGFIAYPISFLIGFFTDVMNAAGTPTCSLEGGSIFGVNADVDLCTMQDKVPVIYNGIITFIRAAVAFTLIFALFRKYHEVVGEGGKA